MTACRNKARGAVVAALAGALTLGAAPMVALATNGASLMADASDDFSLGKVAIALDAGNKQLDIDNIEVVAGTTGDPIKVTAVKLGNGTTVTGTFDVSYASYTDSNDNGVCDKGEEGSSSTTLTGTEGAGKYVAIVTSTNYPGGKIYLSFDIVNKSLKDATLFDVNPSDPDDVSDTTVTFDGVDQKFTTGDLGIALDGKPLKEGTDYTVQTFNADGEKTVPHYAGDYTAVVTGINAYDGSSTKIAFTVEEFELSKAPVTLDAGAVAFNNKAHEPKIDAVEGLDPSVYANLQVVANDGVALEKGHYTYTVKVDDKCSDADFKASVTGEADATLDVVDHTVTTFTYNGKPLADRTVNLSNENHFVFDASKIKAVADDGKTVPSDYVVVEVVNKETGEVSTDPSLINTPGTWLVTVKVDAQNPENNFTYGGSSDTVTFTVISGAIKNATMLVTYDGVTANSFTGNDYLATDYLKDIKVTVYDTNKNELVEGEDYTVVVTKDGAEVSEIVNAGVYTITVKSDTYKVGANAKATFEVDPVTLAYNTVRVTGTFNNEHVFLPYTGDVLNPGYEWKGSDGVWRELPSDVYTVTYKQDGDIVELKEPGDYTVDMVVSDANGNFTAVMFSKNNIKVSDQKVFADVPNNEWYSEYIYTASGSDFGYMTGYAGTKLFGPTDNIKRGDVAVVLYKMCGNWYHNQEEGLLDPDKAYETGFSDVDPHQYYARAIQWASKVGIVSGDDGKDTFRPADTVTREELAKMLYKYMELQGKTSDVDEDAILSEYEDESTVSDWAREYVAWMVDQDVMGQDSGLKGTDPIMRLEVATMTVRLQPEGRLDGFMR